jgi:hypothetical protein
MIVAVAGAALIAGPSARGADAPIDLDRQIRPILSNNCFACHGPDAKARKADLRLDVKESALAPAASGAKPIVPGNLKDSELLRRITSTDPEVHMPPASTNKSLKPEEIDVIRRWIEQGAEWQERWAFTAPKRAALPKLREARLLQEAGLLGWPRNAIDHFILARLGKEGLAPSAEASKETLIRRVTLDLTGLPPTLAEIDAFLADDSPQAYERLVDRLLQSPRYGEHMARFWLDAARYGDTHGLHLDNYREMWPYRDWVIKAFNQNVPYDRFTIEQLAGDLLPDPSLDQLVATGFIRCHVTTSEGGSIEEEVHIRNVVDRVTTTATVFMGMTFECTRCHDHKYDPFTQKDFYSLSAYFNSMDGKDLDGNIKNPAPVARVPLPEQERQIAELRQQIAEVRSGIRRQLAAFKYVEPETPTEVKPPAPKEVVWIEDETPEGAQTQERWKFAGNPQPVFSGKKSLARTATGLSQWYFERAAKPLSVGQGDRLFAHVYLDAKNPPKQIMLQWNDGSWEHRAYWGANQIPWGQDNSPSRRRAGELPKAGEWVRLEIAAADVGLNPGAQISGWAFTQFDGAVYWDKAGILSVAGQQAHYDSLVAWQKDVRAGKAVAPPGEIHAIAKLESDERTDTERRQLLDYFVEHVYTGSRQAFEPLHAKIEAATKQISQIESSFATTLIFRETTTPRQAYVLHRGEYDKRREPVNRGTPPVLPPLPQAAPNDRLGVARWLVDPSHPLTARVAVNRFWQQLFGAGLVKTAEDFGAQGQPPTHPELLDWLAVEFRESGWDVKAMMKRLVMSAAYRQSSRVTPELVRRDPENRLLARGPRFRLDAETLRDQALAVSGLLAGKLGGPSVKPPQPYGLWEAVGYLTSDTRNFVADTGHDKVHRRSLYTFWKRTATAPQMTTLDAPSREACRVRRERTNTPLQALLLLNEPQYIEAARILAERTLKEGGARTEDRLGYLFRLATGRRADAVELSELSAAYKDHLSVYSRDVAAARKLIAIGETPPDAALNPSELAAWTMVANLVLNLDEVVSKG